jgi:hypothetical protein
MQPNNDTSPEVLEALEHYKSGHHKLEVKNYSQCLKAVRYVYGQKIRIYKNREYVHKMNTEVDGDNTTSTFERRTGIIVVIPDYNNKTFQLLGAGQTFQEAYDNAMENRNA